MSKEQEAAKQPQQPQAKPTEPQAKPTEPPVNSESREAIEQLVEGSMQGLGEQMLTLERQALQMQLDQQADEIERLRQELEAARQANRASSQQVFRPGSLRDIVVGEEYEKRLGAVNSALRVEYVPEGISVKWLGHPKLGTPFHSDFRRHLGRGWTICKRDPTQNIDGVGVTDDPEKARTSDGRLMYIPAFEVDPQGFVCLPGQREVLMVGRTKVVRRYTEQEIKEVQNLLGAKMEGEENGILYQGTVRDVAPEQIPFVGREMDQELEEKLRVMRNS